MRRLLLLLAGLLLLGGCGTAPEPTPPPDPMPTAAVSFAYVWNTGSLPPRYHRAETIRLDGSGEAVVRGERSYGDGESLEIPFTVSSDQMEALAVGLRAADALGPWTPDPNPPIGGASAGLEITLDGETVSVPRFMSVEDEARAVDRQTIVALVRGVVPPDVRAEMDAWIEATDPG